jgi:hypothetical protein
MKKFRQNSTSTQVFQVSEELGVNVYSAETPAEVTTELKKSKRPKVTF